MLAELPQPIHVRYEAGHLNVSGPVPQRLRITAQAMLHNLIPSVSDRSIDLICIAAGAYTVDRISKRGRTKANEAGIRTFPICFHVADLSYWSQAAVVNRIAELLNFLTGDLWLVSFEGQERAVARSPQTMLDFGIARRPSHVALYSGGLDSAAGLACELLRGQRDFLLLTASHQTSIRRRAIDQINALKHVVPEARTLSHASFIVNLEGSERLRKQETTQRVRGFLFCASAAVLAAAAGAGKVHIYENGHGAINLPLSAGGLSNGFSTRGAHPTFLKMMEVLVSEALSSELCFVLPFLPMTKAAMVAELAKTPGLANWAQMSRSCVHSSWRERGVAHCGECPACIERHQAFVAAGVVDRTPYSEHRIWEASNALNNDYLRAYLDAALGWVKGDPRVQQRLEVYRILSELESHDTEGLAALHRQHAAETLSVYGDLLDYLEKEPSANTDLQAVA
jgi:Predicted PP-loop superfamily ATPase